MALALVQVGGGAGVVARAHACVCVRACVRLCVCVRVGLVRFHRLLGCDAAYTPGFHLLLCNHFLIVWILVFLLRPVCGAQGGATTAQATHKRQGLGVSGVRAASARARTVRHTLATAAAQA